MSETVTICIPAWRAAEFLHETVDSALSQNWPDIRIVISVDPADDDTWKIAARYAHRANVDAVLQPHRLGWVGNTNAALGLAATRYVMILPHDDILAPDYVSGCIAALKASPDAVAAYSDIVFYHDGQRQIVQESIGGTREDRLVEMVGRHFNAVALRGVIDRSRAPQFALPDFALGDFAADTLWMTRMVCQGPILRVPRPLYTKRFLPRSARTPWNSATRKEEDEMWAVHCMEVVAVIAGMLPRLEWTEDLCRAWEERVLRKLPLRKPYRVPGWYDASRPLTRQVSEINRTVRRRQQAYSWLAQDT